MKFLFVLDMWMQSIDDMDTWPLNPRRPNTIGQDGCLTPSHLVT